MSSQISPLERVHTGLWTDHADGSVKGLTLTVSSATGAYLIAFLAIFVRLSAGNFWDILCYIWFAWQRAGKARDGLFYQQQALLRDSLSDSSALWQFATTAWAWRHKTKHPILRTLPIIIAAIVHFVAFTLAGIFSSRVTSIHSRVLISGPVCGDWTPVDVYNQSGMIKQAEASTWFLSAWKNAQTQARSCHVFNQTGPSQNLQDCKAWGRDFITWTVDQIDQCPFADEMCVDGLAVQIETEKIDSLKHLGINSAPEDRVQVKLNMQCAPIKTDGFKRNLTNYNETGLDLLDADSTWSPVLGYTGYEYGPSIMLSPNYTFVYMNTTFGALIGNSQAPSYAVDVEESYINDLSTSSFIPIQQLNRTDADVILWFVMQNELLFVEPITDPIFRADVPVNSTVTAPNGDDVDIMYYQPPEPLTVLGCAQQWQWFQPDTSRSGKKATHVGGVASLDPSELNYNARQRMIHGRVSNQILNADMSLMTVGLGNDVFLASTASGFGQAGTYLPPDQWIRELDHWTSIYWNTVQLLISEFAVGTGDPKQDQYRLVDDEAHEWMCHAQIVQRSDYASFNMLGFLIILCFGVFFIVLNVTLDPMVQWCRSRRAAKNGVMPVNLWRKAGVLHLQSIMLEAAGKGQWERQKLIPTTVEQEKFEFSWSPESYTGDHKQISPTTIAGSDDSSLMTNHKGARGTTMPLSNAGSLYTPSLENSSRVEVGRTPVQQRPGWLERFAQRKRPQDNVADVVR